ncbi:hypothetical protein L211DRAFT_870729 [Terfezia boudieri ATCC MYA-4762]|uniref:Uncharacterized protein n=1 Tax=Terfezia boudieri ATCC MYA-4762 TaxID=1051890 RepID=A0A3N4LF44_9PEZI|nr:hypothetical protein L211DRAFT_870729 [Terfezia boudieri ATCC MYA-4762]
MQYKYNYISLSSPPRVISQAGCLRLIPISKQARGIGKFFLGLRAHNYTRYIALVINSGSTNEYEKVCQRFIFKVLLNTCYGCLKLERNRHSRVIVNMEALFPSHAALDLTKNETLLLLSPAVKLSRNDQSSPDTIDIIKYTVFPSTMAMYNSLSYLACTPLSL